ncbi:MAG TPA: response regulator [Nitrospinota bacterium]|jgi:CheY-like chemotaxis protein|nr:response regulator [Nitrospinota bacterium]
MDKLKLLIAEDDSLTTKLYTEGLSTETFRLRTVNNGEEAWDIYNSWKPDILILDILMPLMTGYQA